MGSSEKRTDLARSTLFNLSGFLVPVVVQLVTVPLYIRTIGADRYGVMALVWLLLGYFGFFDLGFGRAIASRVAGLESGSDEAREQVFWTGTCLSVLTGAAGGFVVYVAAKLLFGGVFAIPHGLLAETITALPLLVVALPVVTGISALSGALQGREAFGVMNLSQLTGSILYQLFPLAVAMTLSVSLPGLVAAAILGRVVTLGMLYVYCLKRVPARALPRITRSEVLPLLTYGGWVTLTGLISPLLTVFDRFVIGAVTGMTAVTAYTIPYNLVMRIAALPSAFQNALFPRFAMIEETEAHNLQERSTRIVASMMTPLLVIGLIIMRPFLVLWIGPSLAAQAVPVGQILTVGLWANTIAFVPFGFLQSRGRPDLPAKFHVIELVAYVPMLFLLTRHFGVAGAAWAWDARALLDALLLLAAVKLLDVLVYSWFGLVLVGATFAWVYWDGMGPVAYWLVSAGLLAGSIIWSLRAMPQEFLDGLVQRVKAFRRVVSVAE